jgi:8-oxo-dGTP pyrophosphatase MutT (NUDIX family)
MTDNFIEIFLERYAKGLPGREFQMRMAAIARERIPAPADAPPSAKVAAVMILLFPKAGEWHVLLTERTSDNANDKHSGQISFPGGKFEPTDESLEACALRETHEEVGIAPERINVIGAMTPLYIPVSNFKVNPFIGFMKEAPQYLKQETEVKKIIETPLSILLNPENQKRKQIHVSFTMRLEDVPYFDVNGKTVWGATAMMLSEFLEMVKEG